MAFSQVYYGRTRPSDWKQYGAKGITVKVDTSPAGFMNAMYFTSLGGNELHWATLGATSIYKPTPTGFEVFVRWADGSNLTPADAKNYGWYINWMAVAMLD
jgi:hypothetical protein